MKFMIAFVVISCIACQDGSPSSSASEISQIRNTLAVQQVQLDDARARIHSIEMDLDRLAPHTIPAK